jgi:hypothetical protein
MNNNEVMQADFQEVTEIPKGASSLPDTGLMQTRSPYSTAVQVIRPRTLAIVENKCLEEAAIAGDDFYYSWSQGGQVTEGLTVGAALAIARNMGNNAVDVEVRETAVAWYFTGAYIDLETGFNIRRTFRQNKQSPKAKSGKEIYSGERGQDIIYQIGQSKAIRNVVLNAAPSWLARKVFEKAKENVVAKIEKMGPEKAKGLLIQKMSNLGIPLERVIAVFGQAETWDVEKLVRIGGAVRSVEDGRERLDDVFPGATAPASTEVADKVKEALQKQTAKAPEQAKGEAAVPPADEFGRKKTNEILAQVKNIKVVAHVNTLDRVRQKALDEGLITEAQSNEVKIAYGLKHREINPPPESGE